MAVAEAVGLIVSAFAAGWIVHRHLSRRRRASFLLIVKREHENDEAG